MQTFLKWLEQHDPKLFDEALTGWKKGLGIGLAGLGLATGGYFAGRSTAPKQTQMQQTQMQQTQSHQSQQAQSHQSQQAQSHQSQQAQVEEKPTSIDTINFGRTNVDVQHYHSGNNEYLQFVAPFATRSTGVMGKKIEQAANQRIDMLANDWMSKNKITALEFHTKNDGQNIKFIVRIK